MYSQDSIDLPQLRTAVSEAWRGRDLTHCTLQSCLWHLGWFSVTTSNGSHFTGGQSHVSCFGSRQSNSYITFAVLLALLLFTSSYKVEMITIAHISVFQKTLWSSCWFISHSIRLCPVAVRGYMPSGKMEGGKIEDLVTLSFGWPGVSGTQKPHSPWEVFFFFCHTALELWDLSPL